MLSVRELLNKYFYNLDKNERLSIVKSLGYKNINKGLNKILNIYQENFRNKELLSKLPDALKLPKNSLENAIDVYFKTLQQERLDNQRKSFKPHIYIENERSRPDQITIMTFTGIEVWKQVELPENIIKYVWVDQLTYVRHKIQEYMKSCWRLKVEKQFGKVQGFIYRPYFDKAYRFLISGELVDEIRGDMLEETGSVSVKGKKIPFIIKS